MESNLAAMRYRVERRSERLLAAGHAEAANMEWWAKAGEVDSASIALVMTSGAIVAGFLLRVAVHATLH